MPFSPEAMPIKKFCRAGDPAHPSKCRIAGPHAATPHILSVASINSVVNQPVAQTSCYSWHFTSSKSSLSPFSFC